MATTTFFRRDSPTNETCLVVDADPPLDEAATELLRALLREDPHQQVLLEGSLHPPAGAFIQTIGPRLAVETAFSSNAVAIARACGIPGATRIERYERAIYRSGSASEPRFDRMTEEAHGLLPPSSFLIGSTPKPVRTVPVTSVGVGALEELNRELRLGFDAADVAYLHGVARDLLRRDLTDAEVVQIAQMISDHSRHRRFGARIVIDGVEMPASLFELVKRPYQAAPGNSIIGFFGNASAIYGWQVRVLQPLHPGAPSALVPVRVLRHLTLTCETHNHPSMIEPFEGAATGNGGDLRDAAAPERGGLHLFSIAGFATGNLRLPGDVLPWEELVASLAPPGAADALTIAVRSPAGAFDYGNKYGVPVTLGFFRTAGLLVPAGAQRELVSYVKPVVFCGNAGTVDAPHARRGDPEPGMAIVAIGGPAYRIGFGGGSASSQIGGTIGAELDFASVQRGDAEMGQRCSRVIRACVELGEANPIVVIHDQGAGGPANVLTELVETSGGRIQLRRIRVADPTMSSLEIWVCEYQERYGILIRQADLPTLDAICAREGCPYELLGTVTGSGRIVVEDERDGSTPIDLPIAPIISGLPRSTIHDVPRHRVGAPLVLPEDLTIADALSRVLRLPSVASKEHLVHRVDRSVGGLVARQQCCGPLQLPVSDVAVSALSPLDPYGTASSVGEQPLKVLLDPAAGVRMTVSEALLNLASARITGLSAVKASGNWMWPAKLPGKMAAIYEAASALEFLTELGVAIDGGKDSMSMAAVVDGQTIPSPDTFVLTTYAPVQDVTRVLTPDLKLPGRSALLLLEPEHGLRRLGGSALAQVYGQIGDACPDVDAAWLRRTFEAVQQLIDSDLILSAHDRSDGGLITTVLEMAFAGDCGFHLDVSGCPDPIAELFCEEAGIVLEVSSSLLEEVEQHLRVYGVEWRAIGLTTDLTLPRCTVRSDEHALIDAPISQLRSAWQRTSAGLEALRIDPGCGAAERSARVAGTRRSYRLSSPPSPTPRELLERADRPAAAVIREEGSNGDREMAASLYLAGFEPVDVNMRDLEDGRVPSLAPFRLIAFPGGFSYADTFGAGRGWAAKIQTHERLRTTFAAAAADPRTLILGVCNGCQLMARLGLVPLPDLPLDAQPSFSRNVSGAFESRWLTVEVLDSPSVFLRGMAGARLGVWVAHGEGRLTLPDPAVLGTIVARRLAPLRFVRGDGQQDPAYPDNPNGSPLGITGLCDPTGRHLALMPHPERAVLPWQWPWAPRDWAERTVAPWIQLFQNARSWVDGLGA